MLFGKSPFLDLCRLSDIPLYSEMLMYPPKFQRKINYIKSFECQSSSFHLFISVLVNIRARPQTGEIRIGSFNNETKAEDLVLIFFLSIFFFFFFFSFFFKNMKTNKKLQEWRWWQHNIRKVFLTSFALTVTDWLTLPAIQL